LRICDREKGRGVDFFSIQALWSGIEKEDGEREHVRARESAFRVVKEMITRAAQGRGKQERAPRKGNAGWGLFGSKEEC